MVESGLTEAVIKAFNKKPFDIPTIAVTGGKGGTGKTSVAVNLSACLSKNGHRILLVDADADSPTAAIVLGAQPKPVQEVKVFAPKIVKARCDKCGKCVEACRAHALVRIADKYPMLFKELCSGCGACLLACPREAIEDEGNIIGYVHYARIDGVSLVGGELKPGEARSAQVVIATKDFAFKQASKEKCDLMIVDTPPGTHCNVVQSLRGADLALAVTEPTPLGAHDLNLILELAHKLGIPTKVIINKANMPGQDKGEILKLVNRYGAEVISEIPLDENLFQSYAAGTPIVTARPNSPAAVAMMEIAEAVLGYAKMRRGRR